MIVIMHMSRIVRLTARGIIVREGRLLVFDRFRLSAHGRKMRYYSIPGGGIDPDETPEAAVVREMREEMGVVVRAERLLVRQTTPSSLHHYFLCTVTEGEPVFQLDSEEATDVSADNHYQVRWVPLRTLRRAHLFPDYRQALETIIDNQLVDVPQPPIDIVFKRRYTIRNSLTSEEQV